jgi:hypothetical protein
MLITTSGLAREDDMRAWTRFAATIVRGCLSVAVACVPVIRKNGMESF